MRVPAMAWGAAEDDTEPQRGSHSQLWRVVSLRTQYIRTPKDHTCR